MTPKAAKHGRATGKSFKGVMMYLMHDKRQEGENIRTTAERFEWAEYRNIVTNDPRMAYRIMAATAARQDDIKRQAGGNPAGNKSDQVVFHYSLGWHPDEKDDLTKAEMLRAADESIRALGAENHQAVIIAHNDTKHPHVHIVINRVNPEHGKMLDLWNYKKALSKWALAYEKERGTIYCEQREENWKRRDLGEKFSAEKDNAYHLNEQEKSAQSANDNDVAEMWAAQKAKDAELSRTGEQMHQRHSEEWRKLSAWYQQGKTAIKNRAKQHDVVGTVKAQFKPLRSQLGRQQWAEMRDFERKEKRLLGKLENAVKAIRLNKELSASEGATKQTRLFNVLSSHAARKAALEKAHGAQWRTLNQASSQQIKEGFAKQRKDQQDAYKAHRARFNARRDDLKASQNQERQGLRTQWHERKIERDTTAKIIRSQAKIRSEAKPVEKMQRVRAKTDFKKATGRKRSRSRSRKP